MPRATGSFFLFMGGQSAAQQDFIKNLQFLPSSKNNDIHISPSTKAQDSVESYGIIAS